MKLLIGSVYFKTDFWLKYQTFYLRKSTQNYQHVVYLNNVEDKSAFKDLVIVGYDDSLTEMHESHCRGLRKLIEYFKAAEDFDYFLILDSDCFPFRMNWQSYLLEKMEHSHVTKAAAVRFETLSDVVHPSIVFFDQTALKSDFFKFEVARLSNLVGDRFPEVMNQAKLFYPLIRTNKWNPHPIFAGIYGNCFYHHGCGSRGVIGGVYYNDLTLRQSAAILDDINCEFIKDSAGFISKLCDEPKIYI